MWLYHGMPAARLGYLQKRELNWDVKLTEIPKQQLSGQDEGPSPSYYMYTWRKNVVG